MESLRIRYITLAAAAVAATALPLRAANQTSALSPVVLGASLPFTATIESPDLSGDTMPALQSFAKAQYNGEWLLMGGLDGGQHNLGKSGFNPATQSTSVYVIDPTTHQVWSRSLVSDPNSGLSAQQIDSLSVTNTEFTQQGSQLYIAGGYGKPATASQYQTYSYLSSVNVPGMIDWVKNGDGTAAGNLRQISDPIFQVTGGEMATTSNGQSHLIFGQNYTTSYNGGVNGIYTEQVRSFNIIDNASGLSIANAVYGPTNDDFRRRDLNVVPIIQNQGGQLVDKLQAMAGVFTPSFGAWTVPVTIDGNGNATEPDPTSASTFKEGFQSYRCATLGLYSASTNTMNTLQFGGISYEYYDPGSNSILSDPNLPYIHDATDTVTDASGNMTQYLLPSSFPTIVDSTSGKTLYLGAETEFFLADGVPTYANGVINLDALPGPTLVGYFFGGIASDAPNGGTSVASNGLFPVIITPQAVPEPASMALLVAGAAWVARHRRREGHSRR